MTSPRHYRVDDMDRVWAPLYSDEVVVLRELVDAASTHIDAIIDSTPNGHSVKLSKRDSILNQLRHTLDRMTESLAAHDEEQPKCDRCGRIIKEMDGEWLHKSAEGVPKRSCRAASYVKGEGYGDIPTHWQARARWQGTQPH